MGFACGKRRHGTRVEGTKWRPWISGTASRATGHARDAAGLAPPPGRTFVDLPEPARAAPGPAGRSETWCCGWRGTTLACGYRWVHGVLARLGHYMSETTVRRILRAWRHLPAPAIWTPHGGHSSAPKPTVCWPATSSRWTSQCRSANTRRDHRKLSEAGRTVAVISLESKGTCHDHSTGGTPNSKAVKRWAGTRARRSAGGVTAACSQLPDLRLR